MTWIEHLRYVLDDSQHPGTTPAWVAILVFVLVVLLIARLIVKPCLRSMRKGRGKSTYNAVLHHHQKQHEGERW